MIPIHEEMLTSSAQLTIVVQGIANSISLDALDHYRNLGDVVFSTWDDGGRGQEVLRSRGISARTIVRRLVPDATGALAFGPAQLVAEGLTPGVSHVEIGPFSEVERYARTVECGGYHNLYYHALSTLGGLLDVTTPYAIKVRTDERYRLDAMVARLRDDPDKLYANNVLFFPSRSGHFRVGDHAMAARTEWLRGMFALSKTRFETGDLRLPGTLGEHALAAMRQTSPHRLPYFRAGGLTCEQVFCTSYLRAKGIEPDVLRARDQVIAHVDVVPLREMQPYVWSISKQHITKEWQQRLESDVALQKQLGILVDGDHLRVTSERTEHLDIESPLVALELFGDKTAALGLRDAIGIQSIGEL